MLLNVKRQPIQKISGMSRTNENVSPLTYTRMELSIWLISLRFSKTEIQNVIYPNYCKDFSVSSSISFSGKGQFSWTTRHFRKITPEVIGITLEVMEPHKTNWQKTSSRLLSQATKRQVWHNVTITTWKACESQRESIFQSTKHQQK